MNKYFLLAFIFAVLSSLRIQFLPEFQLIIMIMLLIVPANIERKVLFVIITILCTHHYAIPDAVFRFQGDLYPSIYTKAYFGIKLLDVLTLFMFVYSLKNIKNAKYLLNKGLPLILIPLSLMGIFYLNSETFAVDIFIFSVRSYMLLFSLFLITVKLDNNDIILVSKLAIFSWSMKMLFAILFPHEAPLFREMFGINGIIYFAGDEYLTIGFFLMAILMLNKNDKLKRPLYFFAINFILILTLIAQRKGGVPSFIILNIILLIHFYIKKKIVYKIFNGLIMGNFFSGFLFLYIFVPTLPDIIQLGFKDYSALAQSAMKSIQNLSFFNILTGISPFGKYELIGLDSIFDHSMSFGKEVGEIFRYQIWTIPGERLILNVGIIGYFYFVFYLFYKAYKEDVVGFYLIFSIIPVFYFALITPVVAIASGISLAALIKCRKEQRMLSGTEI